MPLIWARLREPVCKPSTEAGERRLLTLHYIIQRAAALPAHAARTPATPTSRGLQGREYLPTKTNRVQGVERKSQIPREVVFRGGSDGASALQPRPGREGGCPGGKRGRASGTKLARFGRATVISSCERPEVRCEGRFWGVFGAFLAPSLQCGRVGGPGSVSRPLGSCFASPSPARGDGGLQGGRGRSSAGRGRGSRRTQPPVPGRG